MRTPKPELGSTEDKKGKGPDFVLFQMFLQSQGKVEEWEDRAPPMKGKGPLT